jgi:hypothetical protein
MLPASARRTGRANPERSETVDEKKPFPSAHFGTATREALAKAGTVELPSPRPASGRLYLGINPDSDPELPSGAPHYFLRLVQIVSPNVVITRIVDLKEFRGVSVPAPTKEDTARRKFQTVNEIAKHIAGAISNLTNVAGSKREVYEVCLFEDAVIYVLESAPVFIRINKEFGVSAAEAGEYVERQYIYGCTCVMELPFRPPTPPPNRPECGI